mmetsp:Transcript_5256/g.11660  ORF Transcript_5256/g.11660 Transcript_5256/m.11660 type:complete len:109 (-) Transcript_5256:324-650(-)
MNCIIYYRANRPDILQTMEANVKHLNEKWIELQNALIAGGLKDRKETSDDMALWLSCLLQAKSKALRFEKQSSGSTRKDSRMEFERLIRMWKYERNSFKATRSALFDS